MHHSVYSIKSREGRGPHSKVKSMTPKRCLAFSGAELNLTVI